MGTSAGRRVLVTRGASQSAKLSDGLRAHGIVPVEVPVIRIVAAENMAPIESALRNLGHYDWIVLTSTNTVRILSEYARSLGIGFPPRPQVAAVGSATAHAAREAGFTVTCVPDAYVAEDLVRVLRDQVRGQRILLARAEAARDVIPDALRDSGAQVDVVDVYRNILPDEAPQELRRARAGQLDAATFASSSSVIHLEAAAREAGLPFPFLDVAAISIGPITSRSLHAIGWTPVREADPHDIPGLVAAVARYLESQPSR
jgi:uroporphyrinogen-III synthase